MIQVAADADVIWRWERDAMRSWPKSQEFGRWKELGRRSCHEHAMSMHGVSEAVQGVTGSGE